MKSRRKRWSARPVSNRIKQPTFIDAETMPLQERFKVSKAENSTRDYGSDKSIGTDEGVKERLLNNSEGVHGSGEPADKKHSRYAPCLLLRALLQLNTSL